MRKNYSLVVNSWELYYALKEVSSYLAKPRNLGK